jgi:hypothetical protein
VGAMRHHNHVRGWGGGLDAGAGYAL